MKPEYAQHRKPRSVSRDARLLNIHLWNLADDEGRLQELPQWILGAVFPTDEDVSPAVLRGWLEELESAELILRYEVDGQSYIYCHDFRDHQSISKPKPSKLPPPPVPDGSGNGPGRVPDESSREGNGREQGMEGNTTAGESGDPDPVLAVLDRVAFHRGVPSPKPEPTLKACSDFADRDFEQEVSKFEHYWTHGPGEKRPLSDVAWAWRNWLERAKPAPADGGRGTSPRESVSQDLADLEEAHAAALAEEAQAA